MSRNLSATFRSAIYAQETTEVFLVLITLDHDDLGSPLRVTSDAVNTVSNGNTYYTYPFEISLPDDSDEHVSQGRIMIDNISRDIVEAVRTISSPPSLDIEIVLASDPDTVEAEFTNFQLQNVTYDANTVSGELTIESLMAEPFPGDSFTPSLFPGMF